MSFLRLIVTLLTDIFCNFRSAIVTEKKRGKKYAGICERHNFLKLDSSFIEMLPLIRSLSQMSNVALTGWRKRSWNQSVVQRVVRRLHVCGPATPFRSPVPE